MNLTVTQTICTLDDGNEIQMMQKWPVRTPRPFTKKHAPEVPLQTGQRILDFLFPLAKGGTAGIWVLLVQEKQLQQQLAKWSDAILWCILDVRER